MKRIVLIVACLCFSVGLIAQTEKQNDVQSSKFKPKYAGTSIDAGFMLTPNYGSAYYVAPKLRFQTTPRLFVNTGITFVQYNLSPSQTRYESSPLQQSNATGAYFFTEGTYLLTERWSINGSAMKSITPQPARNATPYRIPNEAVHFGIDYKITPNITFGARVGYSSN